MAESLSGVWVNGAELGTNVLRDGSGEFEERIITCSGTIASGGPQVRDPYVLGLKERVFFDVECVNAKGGCCIFKTAT